MGLPAEAATEGWSEALAVQGTGKEEVRSKEWRGIGGATNRAEL